MVYCSLVIDNLHSDKRFIRLFGEILAKDYPTSLLSIFILWF